MNSLKTRHYAPLNKPGFTLVELLVVIAIVAILAGLAAVAATSSLATANQVKCQTNLKQIGMALFTYAGDNDGNLPQTTYDGNIQFGQIAPDTGKPGWVEQLDPYTSGNHNLFKCPTSLYPNAPSNYFLSTWAAYYANGQTFPTPPLRINRSQQPSCQILAGDATTSVQNIDADDDDAFGAGLDPGGLLANNPSNFGHRHKTNLLFFDGHVESVSGFDKSTMSNRYEGVGYNYKSTSPTPP